MGSYSPHSFTINRKGLNTKEECRETGFGDYSFFKVLLT